MTDDPNSSETTEEVYSPFTQDTRSAVQEFGEIAIIENIRKTLGEISPPTPHGIGDDCAVWTPPPGEQILLTVDPVVYGQHFSEKDHPNDAGAKLLKRNLSDIAAMGGKPGPALLSLVMGPDVSHDWLMHFVHGLAQACQQWGVPLSGGDVAAGDPGTFVSTLTQTGSATLPITREGAQIHSPIYVTGALGGSLLGRHLHFHPRLEEGQWLAQQDSLCSMIDISDGLAKDLLQLLPQGSQANLEMENIPIHPEAETLQQAFCDGEDYELLFTLAPGVELQDWPFATPVQKIGHIRNSRGRGSLMDISTGKPIEFYHSGYEHFHG
jgi:thiamine-monophosphate kinase